MKILIWTAVLMATLLLAGAVFTVWRTSRTESAFPPAGRFMDQPAVRLHYQVSGQPDEDHPSLILLHGASTNLNDFFALREALPASLQQVAIDRPGAGYSQQSGTEWLDPAQQARAVLTLQSHLGIKRAVWVGHSLAGSVVMAGLLDSPQQVVGGVMLAGAAYPWDDGVDVLDHLPGVPIVGPLVTHSLIAPAGAMRFDAGIETAFAPNPVPTGYRQRTAIDLYLRPKHFAATARDIRRLSDYLAGPSQQYPQISQPVLLIHGDADTIVPAWNHADRLIEILPSTTYRLLPDTGHQPHHVHAGQVATWITEFVADQGSGFVQQSM